MRRSKYSQDEEESFVIDYFRVTHGRSFKGRVLDIGANDGITYSNSRALIEMGWEAILVEPSNAAYSKLKELYKNDRSVYLFGFAIGTINSTVPFYESGNINHTPEDIGLLSTMSVEHLHAVISSPITFKEYRVQCFKFENFLRLIPSGVGHIFDFITIDAEGMDYDILTQIDLTELQCQCLCIEYDSYVKKSIEPFVEYAESHGMKLGLQTRFNLIFIRE